MYHDIAEQLIQDILAGQYPVKLPTEQVLMDICPWVGSPGSR